MVVAKHGRCRSGPGSRFDSEALLLDYVDMVSSAGVRHRTARLGVALVIAVALHGLLLVAVPSPGRETVADAARPIEVELVSRSWTASVVGSALRRPGGDRSPRPPAKPELPRSSTRRVDRVEMPVVARASHPEEGDATPVPPVEPLPPSIGSPEIAPPSYLERVIGAGTGVPALSMRTLDRALEKPDPYAWLVPGVRREDALQGPLPPEDYREQLTRTADGGYSYHGEQFHAEIFADGSVVLYDPPYVRARWLGIPVERLPLLFKDPRAELRRAVAERREELEQQAGEAGFSLNIDALDFLAVLNLILTAPAVGGAFDITETAMRMAGEDPYASAKSCFLAGTEELRDEMRLRHDRRRERRALDGLRAHLCEVWADTRVPAPERRSTLFQLWDECAESDAGHSARAIIVAFIQESLPAGSIDGFGPDELRLLNARRTGTRIFSPYVGSQDAVP